MTSVPKQVVRASDARVAARDYRETHVAVSIGSWVWRSPVSGEVLSDEELDACALRNEAVFRARYGFDAPRALRESVIGLRQRYGLTVRTVRLWRRSRLLRINGLQVELVHQPIEKVLGWGVVGLTSVQVAGLLSCLVAQPSAPALWGTLAYVGLTSAMAARAYHHLVYANRLHEQQFGHRCAANPLPN